MQTRRRSSFARAFLSFSFLTGLLLVPHPGYSQGLLEMQKDPGQWVLPGKNYSLTRYSELNQITAANVTHPRVASTSATCLQRAQDGAPLLQAEHMYLIAPSPDT